MEFHDNPEIELAYKYIQYTNKNVFLTGKAGTGKTTFLNNLKYNSHKRMIVVAPTGVAAINAGGVTIHSFFQLPFTPFVPEESNMNSKQNQTPDKFKLRKNKIKLLKSIDLLIIDEISMVRADLLDAVDSVLRRYRNNSLPFGGIQLLLIGDLHQLSPVIKEDEWSIIREYYKNVFFFNSNALNKTDFVTIELNKIYRQEDDVFIEILGEIRDNKISTKSIEILNQRYIPNFITQEDDSYIILTTHNATALEINLARHEKIVAKTRRFKAEIKGDFPEFIFPTSENLELKAGAQVMFIKNDSSADKLYYNGKIGKIIRFEEDIIYVKCPDDFYEIPVKREMWENIKYKYNEKNQSIEEDVAGSFCQYPLKLAWAITVHKSQGLTFEKAVIDIKAAFAFGQVYVALSRCRSLNGLVLMSEFSEKNIKSDFSVEGFTKQTREAPPDSKNLQQSMIQYQQVMIFDLFDFENIRKGFFYIRKIVKENLSSFDSESMDVFTKLSLKAEEMIFKINQKFLYQLNKLFADNVIPQDNAYIQERIIKASKYYHELLNETFIKPFSTLVFDPDNKDLNNTICDAIEKFELSLFIKTECLKKSFNGFNSVDYIKCKADSEVSFKSKFNQEKNPNEDIKNLNENLELFDILNAWRKSIAKNENIPVFMILQYKTIAELIKHLPQNKKELLKIKGFGKVKLEKYGSEILEIISDYCIDNKISRNTIFIDEHENKKKKKEKTHEISYAYFLQGMNISEIAATRQLTDSTIFRHLSGYVIKGAIEITKIIPKSVYDDVSEIYNSNPKLSISQIYEMKNGEYSYEHIRLCTFKLRFSN